MKKLFVVLVLMAAGFARSAGQSMLKISTKDNSQISVSVDDRHFNKTGTSITVGDLPFGGHYLKIYAIQNDRRGRGREEVIYQGRIKTYSGMVTLLVYDPATDERDMQTVDMDTYLAAHPISNKGKFSGTTQGDVNNYNANNDNNNQSNEGAASSISPQKFGTLTDSRFAEIKKTVGAKRTDTDKMNELKEDLKNEKVTTNQVADMMDLFTFEATKVEFAKWAYQITVDTEYFIDLESKFAYKTSQDDLDKFLNQQKQK